MRKLQEKQLLKRQKEKQRSMSAAAAAQDNTDSKTNITDNSVPLSSSPLTATMSQTSVSASNSSSETSTTPTATDMEVSPVILPKNILPKIETNVSASSLSNSVTVTPQLLLLSSGDQSRQVTSAGGAGPPQLVLLTPGPSNTPNITAITALNNSTATTLPPPTQPSPVTTADINLSTSTSKISAIPAGVQLLPGSTAPQLSQPQAQVQQKSRKYSGKSVACLLKEQRGSLNDDEKKGYVDDSRPVALILKEQRMKKAAPAAAAKALAGAQNAETCTIKAPPSPILIKPEMNKINQQSIDDKSTIVMTKNNGTTNNELHKLTTLNNTAASDMLQTLIKQQQDHQTAKQRSQQERTDLPPQQPNKWDKQNILDIVQKLQQKKQDLHNQRILNKKVSHQQHHFQQQQPTLEQQLRHQLLEQNNQQQIIQQQQQQQPEQLVMSPQQSFEEQQSIMGQGQLIQEQQQQNMQNSLMHQSQQQPQQDFSGSHFDGNNAGFNNPFESSNHNGYEHQFVPSPGSGSGSLASAQSTPLLLSPAMSPMLSGMEPSNSFTPIHHSVGSGMQHHQPHQQLPQQHHPVRPQATVGSLLPGAQHQQQRQQNSWSFTNVSGSSSSSMFSQQDLDYNLNACGGGGIINKHLKRPHMENTMGIGNKRRRHRSAQSHFNSLMSRPQQPPPAVESIPPLEDFIPAGHTISDQQQQPHKQQQQQQQNSLNNMLVNGGLNDYNSNHPVTANYNQWPQQHAPVSLQASDESPFSPEVATILQQPSSLTNNNNNQMIAMNPSAQLPNDQDSMTAAIMRSQSVPVASNQDMMDFVTGLLSDNTSADFLPNPTQQVAPNKTMPTDNHFQDNTDTSSNTYNNLLLNPPPPLEPLHQQSGAGGDGGQLFAAGNTDPLLGGVRGDHMISGASLNLNS